MQARTPIAALMCACALLAAACAKTETEDDAAVQDTAAMAPAPAAAGAPSDAEIAHIAVTANSIDVDNGNLAKDKAQNAEVKSFAQRMITDHTAVNEQASALAQKLNLTPADNATSQQLQSAADQTRANLQGLSGAAFDKAYMDAEVAFHQQVLDALDQTLVPNAQNAELKALLEQARAAVASHLDMAKAIQGKLPAQ